jgi:transcriptional regulator with XRE-family HTH domain
MVNHEPPAVARRRLRLALRKEREAKGLTQGQVAQALEWSLSKVNRIESGDVTISGTDLHALLKLLDVTDPEHIGRLTEDARASRRRGWWDEPRYREHVTSPTLQLLQFESQASTIRSFNPTLVPGILQIRPYAEAILNSWGDDLSEEDRATRLEVRLLRRSKVLDQADPPYYLLILDESVIYREVGGPKVMAEQLYELAELSRRPNVEIRITPFRNSAILTNSPPFTIFDLGDEENAIVYREGYLIDEIDHNPEKVGRHRRLFERMWELSDHKDESTRLIKERAAMTLASLDRDGTFYRP